MYEVKFTSISIVHCQSLKEYVYNLHKKLAIKVTLALTLQDVLSKALKIFNLDHDDICVNICQDRAKSNVK